MVEPNIKVFKLSAIKFKNWSKCRTEQLWKNIWLGSLFPFTSLSGPTLETRKCFSKKEEWERGREELLRVSVSLKGALLRAGSLVVVWGSQWQRGLCRHTCCRTVHPPLGELLFLPCVHKKSLKICWGSLESWSLLPRKSCKLGSRWSQCKDRGTSMEGTPHLLSLLSPSKSLFNLQATYMSPQGV